MRVEDVMTKQVKTVAPETPLKEVARLLTELRISGLPVMHDGELVGVISEADILIKERGTNPGLGGLVGLLFDETADIGRKLHALTAGEAMSSPPITIGPARPVSEAAGKMIDRIVNRLPVVDDGKLVGIVTRADLVRAFVRSDEVIAREIREEVILHTLWIPPETLSLSVEAGQVTIGGHVESEQDAVLIERLTRRVPGVVGVICQLTWDPDGKKPRAQFLPVGGR
ncbi:MAG TPA: CBS domain-containing protein [Gaiellaceae bacterium]|nr:CBS domain-containing protein [Gaiellaceae bacterium]